jgi:hypothetical protein
MTKMQRRHFEFIAGTIRNSQDLTADEKALVARVFANRLGVTNSNFKRDKFIEACKN